MFIYVLYLCMIYDYACILFVHDLCLNMCSYVIVLKYDCINAWLCSRVMCSYVWIILMYNYLCLCMIAFRYISLFMIVFTCYVCLCMNCVAYDLCLSLIVFIYGLSSDVFQRSFQSTSKVITHSNFVALKGMLKSLPLNGFIFLYPF